MEGQLEMISDCMRESPEGDDQKGLVRELLTECEDMQKHLENLAVEVIELPDGADTFNRITVSLDRLARLQAKYPGWCATPAGEMPPASPAPSFDIGAAHAAHEQYERSPSVSANGDHVVERQKKKKSSKEKKRRDPPSEDFGTSFPTGGDAFTQSWPPADEMDGGWGASGSGGASLLGMLAHRMEVLRTTGVRPSMIRTRHGAQVLEPTRRLDPPLPSVLSGMLAGRPREGRNSVRCT